MEFDLFCGFFLFLFSSLAIPALSLSSDGLALLSLKSAVDSSPAASTAFSDWNEVDADPCKWTGVSCSNSSSGDPRVVALSLAGRSLAGYIPSELGNLVYLRRLNLHGNSFHGSLPAQLFNATSLHSLYLYDNNFSGEIPPSMCNLPRIQNLDLSRNSFTGPITKGLRNCHQLQRLVLAGNKLSGNIPTGIWSQLTDLVRLDLSSNDLTGPIPVDLGELQSLSETLNLSFNHLTGKIPRSLANLPMTVSFDLRSNNLSGEIPQTGSFASQGPTAFLNNPSLCGFPLQRSCDNSPGTAASTPDSNQHGQTSKHRGLDSGTIVLISTADAAAVAFVGLIIIYIYWKKKDDSNSCSCTGRSKLGGHNHERQCCACFSRFSENESEADSEKGSGVGAAGSGSNAGGAGEGELVAIDKSFSFELDELLRASAYVLGKSGLGIVYKVVLGNGVPVAVRRLGEGGEQRYKEFSAEIDAIGKVKHPNIVRLRAYYWAPDEKLLISDFVSNGNLATALQGKTGQLAGSITWSTRLRIAKGTARGLAYLHECSPRKFVHGDIKPTNILLDNDFHPFISDFGLSRLIHITGSDPSSSGGFVGSALPYMKPAQTPEKSTAYKAPEARIPGTRPTQKWDVYSFGVVLLQLLTGKSPELSSPTTSTSSEIQDLVKWVRKGFEEEIPLSEMVDPALLQEVHAKKEVLAVFHLALGCTEGDPEIRPRMKSVSENLDRLQMKRWEKRLIRGFEIHGKMRVTSS
ncbi:hypothetical protein V2J09_003815 [Rumex salicifolius]